MPNDDFVIDVPIAHETEIDDSAFLEGFDVDLPKQLEPTNETDVIPEVELKPTFDDEMAAEHGMDSEEFIQSQEELQERELYGLMSQGISEEEAREVLELRQYKEYQQQEAKAREERENQMFNEFMTTFKQVNGRDWNPDQDTISPKIWADVAQGKTLKEAYTTHDEDYLFLKGFNGV